MKLSIIINCDSRPRNDNAEKMFHGISNWDFLTEGIENKVKPFSSFDKEVICYLDKHQEIPVEIIEKLKFLSDCLIIRNHTSECSFNCFNYLRALYMASGDIIVHFDQDTAMFVNDSEYINQLISYLNEYKFVSYPSFWSPNAVDDQSFQGRMWASTRFFMCKRETLDFKALEMCIRNPDWAYETYGDVARRLNWLEHFLTLTNENSVYYPPIEFDKGVVFCWDHYIEGVLQRLNKLDYKDIQQYIIDCGGMHYPCDLTAK